MMFAFHMNISQSPFERINLFDIFSDSDFHRFFFSYAFYSANWFYVRFHMEIDQLPAPFKQTNFFGEKNLEAITFLLVIFQFQNLQ